ATAHIVLGGNQDDAVTVDAFAKDRLLGFRWPAPSLAATNTERAPAREAEVFQELLAHVLEMEGGFTDDPDDPGGPTNKGIILEVYARHTGRPLSDATRTARVGELREISDALVEDIYRKRYWRPSRAAEMPAAIAFMHFDASVNHGVRGAAKLLQRALKAQSPALEVDGEIGPLTMAAVTRADQLRLIDDYAEARRRKYRALKHFWKFGRGWLNRVARTEARARARLGRPPAIAQVSSTHTKGADMTTLDGAVAAPKWWGSSMTIWGAAITALSTVLPIIGPAIGVDVTPDIVRQAGEQVVAIVQAIGGLAGTLMTIYGRMRALQPLERRQMQLKL
ncbi:MAG: glycosyl hydrolase 108 family protein, partial [Hyphomicrobiaceae bacterium]